MPTTLDGKYDHPDHPLVYGVLPWDGEESEVTWTRLCNYGKYGYTIESFDDFSGVKITDMVLDTGQTQSSPSRWGQWKGQRVGIIGEKYSYN